jgi:hypothetical protein
VIKGQATVKLACHRGSVGGVRRGVLTLTLRTAAHHANEVTFATVVLTRQRYALPAGHTRRVTLQL